MQDQKEIADNGNPGSSCQAPVLGATVMAGPQENSPASGSLQQAQTQQQPTQQQPTQQQQSIQSLPPIAMSISTSASASPSPSSSKEQQETVHPIVVEDLLQRPQELNDTASEDAASSVSSSSADVPDAPLTPKTMRRASNTEMDAFNVVFHKTLKEVETIARLRVGDTVITPFGEGELLEMGDSNIIALPWGILCTRLQNIHRKLPEPEFKEAMDHLNEIRKLHFAVECLKLNIPLQIDGCTACLLERPDEYKVQRKQPTQTRQTRWNRFKQRVDDSRSKRANKKQRRLWICDVCGNRVCKFHDRHQQNKSSRSQKSAADNHFHMCADCAYDLNQEEHQLNPFHPNVLQSLERLLLLYTRMCLQLSFWLPYIPELCLQIFQHQRKHAKISLANTSLGFVGAALGVASAATMLTPAGPAILIAAMATSATSGTLQATHQGYHKYVSSKVTHEMSDRLIAWQGLCCGILQSLEQLRKDLLAERQHYSSAATFGRFAIKNNTKKEADVWSKLAVGSIGVTRSAFTGIGLSASVGAGYAQVISSGLQTVPLVGAAFSVAYMGMDSANIYSHLQQLSTPGSYVVRLKQLQNSQTNGGLPHVSTVETEVDMLSNAIRDINYKLKLLREERDQMQQKLPKLPKEIPRAVKEQPQDDTEAAAGTDEPTIPAWLTLVPQGAKEVVVIGSNPTTGSNDDEPNDEL